MADTPGTCRSSGDRKALVVSGLLTGGYFIIELAIGLWTGVGCRHLGRLPHVLRCRRHPDRPRCAAPRRARRKPIADVRLGLTDVHHVHAWSLTSGRNVFSGHVCVSDFGQDAARVQRAVQRLLKERFKVFFSTVQVEETSLKTKKGAEAIDIMRQPPVLAQERAHDYDVAGMKIRCRFDEMPTNPTGPSLTAP